jgi:hypothetical protein
MGVVTVNPTPTVATSDISVCDNGTSGTITATPSIMGGTFLWSPNNETSASINVPATTATYSVVYTLNGCPSTIESATVSLATNPTVSVNDISICDGATGIISATPSTTGGTYSWLPNNETTQDISVSSTPATYSVIYTLNGCSSPTQSASVTTTPLPNNAVTTVNNEITATQLGATYQWLDCNNGNALISGETNQTYAPSSNGNYAVEVTLNGCSDTSLCSLISTIGIEELNNFGLAAHPNPTSDLIHIEGISDGSHTYEIIDALGRMVLSGILNDENSIDLTDLSTGNYTLEIDGTLNVRLLKQ